MSLKNKLQIILITYNRAKYARHMLNVLLAEDSPVKDCNLLILDNNSTDETPKIATEFQQKHQNVSYQKNHYNLGIAGNIARAIELANQEYVWILGDDDELHFEAWHHLEEAIKQQKEIIVAANYAIEKGFEKDPASLMFQLTFISACIFKVSLFNDTTMTNVLNNIYTLFPHLIPVVEYINAGKETQIHLLPQALVSNGMRAETDCSYIRGYDNEKIYLKQRSMSWIVGYANVLIELKDKKLLHQMMDNPMHGLVHTSWGEFYQFMSDQYIFRFNWLPFFETVRALSVWKRICCCLYIISPIRFYRRNKWLNVCILGVLKTKIFPLHKL